MSESEMAGEPAPELGSEIAVVGMAGRFPGARDLGEFWANLIQGRECIQGLSEDDLLAAGVPREVFENPHYVRSCAPLPDMEMFDAPFFGFSPREAAILDPQHRHFLECAWHALEDAGHVPDRFRGSIGVFAGSGHNAYMPYNLLTNPDLMRSVGLFLVRHTGNDKDFLTTRVSYLFNLRGPSINVQTACSTSLVAIHLACQSLLTGECDMALAGGVTVELPHRQGYLYEPGEILSPDGHCRAFDADSQGTVFGSGVGVVVLRRLSDAIADRDHVYAVIKGSAVNNDGSMKVGYLAPSVDGQAHAIAEALAIANVDADTISYVEAHGTGTPVGDPIEVAALTQAFRRSTTRTGFCGLGSLKTNIGHLDTAAGVAAFMKVALALEHEQLPPILHFTAPNPACDFESSPFVVQSRRADWPRQVSPRRAGVSSLGVGGTNAHVIVEEAPVLPSDPAQRPFHLIALSAKSARAVDHASARLASWLREHPQAELADVSYTLRVGRQSMKHRRTFVAATTADAVAQLENKDQRGATPDAIDAVRQVAFMFAGGGAQHPGMGRDLYALEPIYREQVDACLAILNRRGTTGVRQAMYPEAGDEGRAAQQLERPSIGLPALFITQYALAQLWKSWGVEPAAMIGHSMGEYTAACLAGVLTLDDALSLVSLRGRLFERVPEGGMLSVSLSAEDLQPYMGPELSIAAINGPGTCVASGPAAAIEALERRLGERDIDTVRIRISIAAHSSMLDPFLGEFERFFAGVRLQPPAIPIVSNLSGTWLTDDEATDPAYWVRHLRRTVRFADGVRELFGNGSRVLLEVGPGRTLASLARMQMPANAALVQSSLRHPEEAVSDLAFVMGVLGRLWAGGVPIDWSLFDARDRRRRLSLPGYPFESQRHWVQPGTLAAPLAASDATDRLAKRGDLSTWTYQPVWRRALPARPMERPGCVLVLSDGFGVGDALAEHFRGMGATVVTVTPAARYGRSSQHQFTVNPQSPPDFEALLAALAADQIVPAAIVHLWTLTGDSSRLDRAASLRMQDLSFYSLLHLAQAIGRADLTTPIRLTVVSNHARRVGTEPAVMSAKATLLGPVRVIPREYPHIHCLHVDLGAIDDLSQDAIARVAAEVSGSGVDTAVIHRGSERWVETFEPIVLPADESDAFRERGVYLLTGGYGGIATEAAAHLARSKRARLALIGRTGVPGREAWPTWLESHPTDDPTSIRIRAVLALEANGAEVLTLTGDVASPQDMSDAVRATIARFGALHGVIHTAGVLDDALIEMKDASSAGRVLAPKLAGTYALEQALEGVSIDMLVLFSSISALAGLPGQIDYAAANAFLDAYAQERLARDGARVVSINWSAWRDTGMAAALAAGEAGDQPTGHPLVERRVFRTVDRTEFATEFSAERHWLLDEHRVRGGQALIPGAGFLEIARAAVTLSGTPYPFELRDVAFVSPFAVPDGATRELRVEVTTSGSSGEFAITSPAASPGERYEHARGTMVHLERSAPSTVDLRGVIERCTLRERVVSGVEQREHLIFGPRWGSVSNIRYGQSEALIELQLPEAFTADLQTMALHPALLDMAMAGAQELIPGFDEKADFFVPLSYSVVRLHRPFGPRLHSHVMFRERESSAGQFAVFDVRIYDESGQCAVEMEEFTMVRVRDRAVLAGTGAHPATVTERSRAMATPRLAVDLSKGIATAEGISVFSRIVASRVAPQLIVSPQDLEAVLAGPPPSGPPATDIPAPAAPAFKGRDLSALEAALTTHAAVVDAAALEHLDTTGEPRVVVYAVYDPDQPPTVSELRKHLRGTIDDDMIPHTVIELDALPRTSDGAIDRQSLRNPFGVAEEIALPETEMELLIAGLWKDLLGSSAIGVHDNFFDVGGHSLLSMRFISRMDKKTGVRLQHEHVVVNTLRQLAAKCDQMKAPTGAAMTNAANDGRVGILGAVRQTVFGADR